MKQQVKITVQRQFDGKAGYVALIRVVGSKFSCASIFASTEHAALSGAYTWCAKYNLEVN